MKLLKLGSISLYGTKIHANASRHSALSQGHRENRSAVEARCRNCWPGRTGGPGRRADSVSLPAEIKRREDRLNAMTAARPKIKPGEARFEQEQAAYEAQVARRKPRRRREGQEAGRQTPAAGPGRRQATDQINLRDEE